MLLAQSIETELFSFEKSEKLHATVLIFMNVQKSPYTTQIPRLLRTLMKSISNLEHSNQGIIPKRFVGKVAPSFCPFGCGAMRHREAPAEHSEHLHLVSLHLPIHPSGDVNLRPACLVILG